MHQPTSISTTIAMRTINYCSLIIIILITGSSCSENIPDCPTKFCILATGWQLTEIYEDDIKLTQDISKFRMALTLPDNKVPGGSFDRTNSTGLEDIGTWKIQNNDKELVLIPESSPEEPYIIEKMTLRNLILIINRDNSKTGPKQLKYVFEPIQ